MSEVQIDKTKSRDNYWDTLKVMLIFLVVYGHIVTHYTNSNQLNTSIYNWIFLFHMPLFVFVSGRFSHIRDKNKYRKGILKIAETYIFFQFIRVFLRYLTGHGLNVIAALTSPSYTLWYLLCLIFWRLLALFIGEDNMKKHCKLILSLSILLCFLGGFIQTNIFHSKDSYLFFHSSFLAIILQ